MSKKVSHPHDSLFKNSMKDVRVAREFFENHLSLEMLKVVDLNYLELVPNTYVDGTLASSESDILYKTRISGEVGYLFLLAEHQSTPDKLLPFRLLKYIICIWDNYSKQHKAEKLRLTSCCFLSRASTLQPFARYS